MLSNSSTALPTNMKVSVDPTLSIV